MTTARPGGHHHGDETPSGYVTVSMNRATWMTRSDCAQTLAASGAGRLLEGRAPRASAPGEGRAGSVTLQIGGLAAVAKRARHGGAARVLGGLYLGCRRIVNTLISAVRLREAGVPTPGVLAAGWRRVLGPLHAHVLVTETVPGGFNLQTALASRMDSLERRAALCASGRAVKSMHDAGFLHADLNLANLVLQQTPVGSRAHIVDLDRGTFERVLTAAQRRSNLDRLLRSWEKWRPGGTLPGPRDAVAFLRAYCDSDRAAMRGYFDDLRRARRRSGLRRLAWRLKGYPGGARPSGRQ
jgi:hypothetical protein